MLKWAVAKSPVLVTIGADDSFLIEKKVLLLLQTYGFLISWSLLSCIDVVCVFLD
jgi:hypothetical protein